MALEKILDAFRHGDGDMPQDHQAMVVRLREQYGSNAAASRAVGIPDSTLRRWYNGAHPSARNAEKAERAMRDVATPRLAQEGFKLQTQDNRDGRLRTISAEQLKLKEGTLDRVREKIVQGDEAGARREFLKGVQEPYYRQYLTPNSQVSRTGTLDGIGGGPDAAVSRAVFGGGGPDAEGGDDYDDYDDLAYEDFGVDDADTGADYGGGVVGFIATAASFTGKK